MNLEIASKTFRLLALVFAHILALGMVCTALAGPPTEGVVVEGVSVPAVALGFTRDEVEAAYGEPSYCQSITAGDFAFCTYNVPFLFAMKVPAVAMRLLPVMTFCTWFIGQV
jgi:hypothetical protein